MRKLAALLIIFSVLLFTHCGESPKQKAEPVEIADATDASGDADEDLQSPLKIALGKKLFFDPILSRDSSVSCASCHIPAYAFSDTSALSTGVGGLKTERNSPSLVNIALHPYFMREGGNPSLEVQVFVPLEGENEMHLPMGMAIDRLKQDESYTKLFKEAFGKEPNAFGITRSLAAYERTILGGSTRYDQFLDGDAQALTALERHGYELFTSDELNCSKCHEGGMLSNFAFENNGTKSKYEDRGRARLTLQTEDEGKFKTPSLRNVALTAPYMFDGSFKTLGEVVDHYAAGGQGHPNQSELLNGFELEQEDRRALIAFMESLTEEQLYLP